MIRTRCPIALSMRDAKNRAVCSRNVQDGEEGDTFSDAFRDEIGPSEAVRVLVAAPDLRIIQTWSIRDEETRRAVPDAAVLE